jgi:hypothetical protein
VPPTIVASFNAAAIIAENNIDDDYDVVAPTPCSRGQML